MRHNIITGICFLLAVLCLLCGCTSSRTTISQNANLNKYRYVSIINNAAYRIPAQLMPYEIQLYDAVEASGLQLINDMRIDDLTTKDKESLLLAKYGISPKDNSTTVTVNFIDYMTGRPVASCQSDYSLGFSVETDLSGAIGGVAKEIAKTFAR